MKPIEDELTKMLKNYEELDVLIKLRSRPDLIPMKNRLLEIISNRIWNEFLVPFAESVNNVSLREDDVVARAKSLIEVYDESKTV